jgi:hypothetical protein
MKVKLVMALYCYLTSTHVTAVIVRDKLLAAPDASNKIN